MMSRADFPLQTDPHVSSVQLTESDAKYVHKEEMMKLVMMQILKNVYLKKLYFCNLL